MPPPPSQTLYRMGCYGLPIHVDPCLTVTANTGRSANVGSTLCHRLRRWHNVEPPLADCVLLGLFISAALTPD